METRKKEIEMPPELACKIWGHVPVAIQRDDEIEIICARCGSLIE